ncbi:MAG: SIMPL domain-containing protein [Candidatus Micrarchaeota archaeon]|nr:SIMPL domain-containing protein [Candidatus Micrarchaeota archaeon]
MAKDKDTMQNVSLALSVIAILAVAAIALGAFNGGIRTITVTASGIAYGYPDQASISMSVNGTGQTAAAANSNLSATVSAIGNALGPYVGQNFSKIQTQSYDLFKTRVKVCQNITKGPTINLPAPFYCSAQIFNGSSLYCCYNQSVYMATQAVTVTIPNINNASSAFSAISNIPNVGMQSLSQSLSQKESAMLMNSSLTSALENATAQAQLLAGSGYTVAVMNISIQGSPYFYSPYANFATAASGSGSSGFFSGRIGVSRSVAVQFRIVPK